MVLVFVYTQLFRYTSGGGASWLSKAKADTGLDRIRQAVINLTYLRKPGSIKWAAFAGMCPFTNFERSLAGQKYFRTELTAVKINAPPLTVLTRRYLPRIGPWRCPQWSFAVARVDCCPLADQRPRTLDAIRAAIRNPDSHRHWGLHCAMRRHGSW